ncbi:immunoglobulin domain-containing protein [Gabonibacter chumensis]|uniref:immunoglobulin domain-containing protein n=1 Tax=Gabonibacter chumensis TaxID=2972474 RepID=UPI002572C0F1|nr:immunoglobulin domain-containing protein [Gabonibacter chumensis]MCR9011826.1 hypothetical protein [Gabonibacter chumensis]
MKKKLLFVLVLFMSFTGFKNGEVKVSEGLYMTKGILRGTAIQPVITEKVPKTLVVKGFEGQIISFYIVYTSQPEATCEVYKDGNLYNGDIEVQKKKVTVTIKEAKTSDSGKYKIVLRNTAGTTDVSFDVTILADQ